MLIAIVNGPDGEQVSEFEDQSIVLGRHGTFRLNDRKVSKHDLVDNDMVTLGKTNFKFKSIN